MTTQENNPTSEHTYREADHFGHTEGIFTVTQAEAAGRTDVIFDPQLGAHRHLKTGEHVCPSTTQTFKLQDGSLIDLPVHMAVSEGLAEWRDEWGPRVNQNGFTEGQQDEIDQMIAEQNNAAPIIDGMSDETPLEVTTFNAQFVAHGIEGSKPADIVDHLEYTPDGSSFDLSETGTRFLNERFGVSDPQAYVSSVVDAGIAAATKAVGSEAIQNLRTAAMYNEAAAADVKALYKLVLGGQPFKEQLRETVKKWSR